MSRPPMTKPSRKEQATIDYLREHGETSVDDIIHALSSTRSSTLTMLSGLAMQGLIVRTGRGVYALPTPGATVTLPQSRL
jgi:DNA-binding IclR family transcriptional regulator